MTQPVSGASLLPLLWMLTRMTPPVSASGSEQQRGDGGGSHRRLNLLGFTRPSVLGGKKHPQRQASANGQATSTVAGTASPPVSIANATTEHKRAATSLGHHTRSRQNTTASISNAAIHQPRQSSYDHARNSAFATSASVMGMGTEGVGLARHSNELGGVRRAAPLQQPASRTSSSLDGQYQQLYNTPEHAHAHRQQAQQDTPYAQQDKLIDTLLHKLVARLPHRTIENRLTTLQTDEHGTRKICASIQQLSRHRLSYILHQLHNELEQVVKLPTRSDNVPNQARQDPLDSLRSQAILLQVTAGCLDWHWKNTAHNIDPSPLDNKTAKQLLGTATFFFRQYYSALFGINNPFYDASSLKSSGQTSTQQHRNSESSTSMVNSLASPSSVSGKYMQEHGTPASTSSPSAFTKRFQRTMQSTTPASLSDAQAGSPNFSPLLRTLKSDISRRQEGILDDSLERKSQQDILKDCLISCVTIINYISASRWEMILTRIRSKLSVQWSAASSANNNTIGQDDIPEMSEIHLLEFSNFNDIRLSSTLSELGSSFNSLRKSAQPVITMILHDILERYMSENPRLFYSMYEDGKKLAFSGQPEALFDTIFSFGDTTQRRSATWPTLSVLLPLCPEIVMQIAMGGGDTRSPMLSKKVLFLDALRKAVRNPPVSDNHSTPLQRSGIGAETKLALVCYVEICNAASHARPIQGRPSPPLWILADEMEVEIKKRLLDPSRPCTDPDGIIDVSLIKDAFIAIGRMSFTTLRRDVIPRFLDPKAPTQCQVAALEAMTTLFKTPDLDSSSLKEAIFIPVMKIIHQAVTSTFSTSANGQPTLSTTSSRSLQIMDHIESERNQLVLAVLNLFIQEPSFLLFQSSEMPQSTTSRKTVPLLKDFFKFKPFDSAQTFGLLLCLMHEDNHPMIQKTVVELLVILQSQLQPGELSEEIDDSLQKARGTNDNLFHAHIGAVALALAKPCMVAQETVENDKLAYKVFINFLKKLAKTLPARNFLVESYTIVLHLSELIGFSALSSSDTHLRNLAGQIIQFAAPIASLPGGNCPNICAVAHAIRQDAGPVVGGNIAQMKRLMKLFRSIENYSPALPMVWVDLYARWRNYAGIFGLEGALQQNDKSVGGIETSFVQITSPDENGMSEWIAISGFLVKTAGLVCFPPSTERALNQLIPSEYLPERMHRALVKQDDLVQLLLGMMRFLESEHLRMRDAAREHLGSELSPDHLHYIIAEMATRSEVLYNARQLDAACDAATLHFDQALPILAQNFERLSTPTSLSIFTCSQIERHLLAASLYASKMESSANVTRLKIKICKAAQAILEKRKQCASSLSASFRNTLAGYLVSFAEDAKRLDLPEKSRCELELQALQSLSVCLEELCIQRPGMKQYRDRVTSCPRMVHSYASFLMDILRRRECHQPEHIWNGRGSLNTRPAASRDLADDTFSQTVRSVTIGAMANLLASNYPQSSSNVTGLCNPSDPGFATNLDVLTATTSQLESLSEPNTRDHFADLVAIIAAPDLSLALSIVDICTSSDQEGIMDLLMCILTAHGMDTRLLKAVIEQEVSTTEHESTLFRGNSAATRLLTTFARTRGYSYLRFLISNLLSSLAQQPLDLTDMDMYSESTDVDEGVVRLEALTEAFLSLICETSHLIPSEIQDLCHHIQVVVRDFFPDSVYTAIGGWIFLRYINPAIISPEIVDLELPEESRKALVLISKLLQALSNNIRFKEPGMKTLNGFIGKHILDMTSFLTQVSSAAESNEITRSPCEPALSDCDKDLIFHFIWRNTERIGSTLLARLALMRSRHWQDDISMIDHVEAPRAWAHLTKILWEIKQAREPESIGNKFTAESEGGTALYRPANLFSSPATGFNTAFRTGFKSQRGNPTVCLVMRAFDSASSDFQGLFMDALRTIDHMKTSRYEIILDCTRFEEDNGVPMAFFQTFANSVDPILSSRLHSIHIYSPSSSFVTYFKKILAMLPISDLENKFRVAQDTFELEDHYPSPSTVLSPSTLELCGRERTLITKATLVCREGAHVRCQIRAGPQDWLIVSSRKRTFFNEIKGYTQDYIPCSTIECVHRRHGHYGASNFEIGLVNGSRIVLLDVEEPESFHQAAQALGQTRVSKSSVQRSICSGKPTELALAKLFSAALCAITSEDRVQRHAGIKLWKQQCRLNGLENESLACETESHGRTLDSISGDLSQFLLHNSDHGPSILAQVLADIGSLSDSRILEVLITVKPLMGHLVEPSAIASPHKKAGVRQSVEHLLELSICNKTVLCYARIKVWPVLLKHEQIIDMVLETALLAFKRVDYSEGTTSIIKELVSLAPLSTVRSKVIARLQGLILAAAGKVAVALDQAQEWSQILGLLELDMHFSQCETRTSSLFVGDLIWIYSMIAGLGSVEESEIIWRAIHSFSISLRSLTGGGEAHSTAVSQTKAAWMILQELQQTDIVEQLQDGYVPQVAIAMHKFISRLTQMSVAFSPSQDAGLYWTTRCATKALQSALSSCGIIQYRSLLVLSQFSIGDATMLNLMQTVRINLADDINSNALQAYMLCFMSGLRDTADIDIAGQLFWIGVGISQAHPLLFATATLLVEAAVACLTRILPSQNIDISARLLNMSSKTRGLSVMWEEFEDFLDVHFTKENFSFAVASLFAKGLQHQDTAEQTTALLRALANLSIPNASTPVPEPNGAGFSAQLGTQTLPACININELGYITALLPSYARASALTMQAKSYVDEGEGQTEYQPILDRLDVDKNEPLVLAASLTMSLMYAATSQPERRLLLRFMHEIAEISPAVVNLLSADLIPLVTAWLQDSNDSDLVDATEALLLLLFSSPSSAQLNGLDITAYVAALGLPRLLDCASFFNFLTQATQDADIARHKLRCCADLLGAFLASDEH